MLATDTTRECAGMRKMHVRFHGEFLRVCESKNVVVRAPPSGWLCSRIIWPLPRPRESQQVVFCYFLKVFYKCKPINVEPFIRKCSTSGMIMMMIKMGMQLSEAAAAKTLYCLCIIVLYVLNIFSDWPDNKTEILRSVRLLFFIFSVVQSFIYYYYYFFYPR